MASHETLTWISVGLELAITVYYAYVTWWGEVRPQRITFLGWTIIGVLGTWISHREHAGLAVYVNAIFVFATLTTFVSACLLNYFRPKRKEEKPNPTDVPLLIIGTALLAVWALQIGPPNFYATAVWVGDSCFAFFVLRHAWRKPHEESLLVWTGTVVVAYLGTLVLDSHSYAASSYTWYILVGNGFIAGALWIRKLQAMVEKLRETVRGWA